MILIVIVLVGILLGVLHARRRGGSGADLAHYAAVYGILFSLLGLLLLVVSGWMGWV